MSEPAQLDLAATAARIEAAARIIITTHTRADGDAVGSTAALARVLRQRGKAVAAYVHESVSPRYAFLMDIERLCEWGAVKVGEVLTDADLLLITDTCSRAQLGTVVDAIEQASIPKLAIDHHQTRDDIVGEICIDVGAGACAQIITRLCDHAHWPIDADTATLLYTGLATDTGWFRFSNAGREVFVTAARLIEAGARPHTLYEQLYLNDSPARVHLLGAVLSSCELHADGRLAVARLTREMLARCGATNEMTEDLINELQRIGSVVASVLLVEPPGEGPIRVGLRSKRGVDVAALAARFGGGGHRRAAGARIAGPMDTVADRVISAMVQAIEGMS